MIRTKHENNLQGMQGVRISIAREKVDYEVVK